MNLAVAAVFSNIDSIYSLVGEEEVFNLHSADKFSISEESWGIFIACWPDYGVVYYANEDICLFVKLSATGPDSNGKYDTWQTEKREKFDRQLSRYSLKTWDITSAIKAG